MGQDFLSQDEVDALLKGVTGESEEDPASADLGGEARPYDLANRERVVGGRMPTLELLNERFAHNLKVGLFNYMHRNVEIAVAPLKVQKYSEFTRTLVVPTNLNLVQVRPLRGTGLFVFDPNLVFLVVDSMFGGDGRLNARLESREFSATEQRIIRRLLTVVFEEYERAWQAVFAVHFEYMRSEMNPQFASIAAPSEIVVSFGVTLEFGGAAAEMHICLPYSMIEPIKETLYGTPHGHRVGSDAHWINLLTSQVQDAEVELAADFGSAIITLRQILEMKVGDVVPVSIDEMAQARVGDVAVMECRYGVQGGRYALRVERFVAESDPSAGNARQ